MKTMFIQAITASILILPLSVNASEQVYVLEIDGLACPFCAYGIEKQLSSVDDVKNIDIDIKQGRIIVTMMEDQTMSAAVAREKGKEAGFSLRRFSPPVVAEIE